MNQTLKFNVTDKIKVNTITINKVEYMTYWHKNESYRTIRMTYYARKYFKVLIDAVGDQVFPIIYLF